MTRNKIILLSSIVSLLYNFDVDAMRARMAARRAAAQQAQQQTKVNTQNQSQVLPAPQQSGLGSTNSSNQGQSINIPKNVQALLVATESEWNDLKNDINNSYVEKMAVNADYAAKTANITVSALMAAGASDAQDFVKKGEAEFTDLEQSVKDQYIEKTTIDAPKAVSAGVTVSALMAAGASDKDNYVEKSSAVFSDLPISEQDKYLEKSNIVNTFADPLKFIKVIATLDESHFDIKKFNCSTNKTDSEILSEFKKYLKYIDCYNSMFVQELYDKNVYKITVNGKTSNNIEFRDLVNDLSLENIVAALAGRDLDSTDGQLIVNLLVSYILNNLIK